MQASSVWVGGLTWRSDGSRRLAGSGSAAAAAPGVESRRPNLVQPTAKQESKPGETSPKQGNPASAQFPSCSTPQLAPSPFPLRRHERTRTRTRHDEWCGDPGRRRHLASPCEGEAAEGGRVHVVVVGTTGGPAAAGWRGDRQPADEAEAECRHQGREAQAAAAAGEGDGSLVCSSPTADQEAAPNEQRTSGSRSRSSVFLVDCCRRSWRLLHPRAGEVVGVVSSAHRPSVVWAISDSRPASHLLGRSDCSRTIACGAHSQADRTPTGQRGDGESEWGSWQWRRCCRCFVDGCSRRRCTCSSPVASDPASSFDRRAGFGS